MIAETPRTEILAQQGHNGKVSSYSHKTLWNRTLSKKPNIYLLNSLLRPVTNITVLSVLKVQTKCFLLFKKKKKKQMKQLPPLE